MEATLISPDGVGQIAVGLDADVRYVGQLQDRRGILCFGASHLEDAYAIAARRGGGQLIVGEAIPDYPPSWPAWPHRGHGYPDHEAFMWAIPFDDPLELAASVVYYVNSNLLGFGIGTIEQVSAIGEEAHPPGLGPSPVAGQPVVLVELGDDDPRTLEIMVQELKRGTYPQEWDGGTVIRSLVEAPAIR